MINEEFLNRKNLVEARAYEVCNALGKMQNRYIEKMKDEIPGFREVYERLQGYFNSKISLENYLANLGKEA